MPDNRTTAKTTIVTYAILSLFAVVLGSLPMFLSLAVDPYEFFGERDRPSAITDLAEKKHYPLWSLAKYKQGEHSLVVFGDSRARALKSKYWKEAGIPGALNVAYGGGTIPEIYSTFNYLKSDPAIKHVVIGIQLRSFDEDHKGGMNRVPEALRMIQNKPSYLASWLVVNAAWDIWLAENEIKLKEYKFYLPQFVGAANAQERIVESASAGLLDELYPECDACILPDTSAANVMQPTNSKRVTKAAVDPIAGAKKLKYANLYQVSVNVDRQLPSKMRRQVEKNGANDWRGFEFSSEYWRMIVEIAEWSKNNGKQVWFVIPPTIQELQATIGEAKLLKQNHELRLKLSELGRVVDFDFPSDLTIDVNNFSDAYHFVSTISRNIVAEIASLVHGDIELARKRLKQEPAVKCSGDAKQLSPELNAVEFFGCRIWGASS